MMPTSDTAEATTALDRAGITVPGEMKPQVMAAMLALKTLTAKLKGWNPP